MKRLSVYLDSLKSRFFVLFACLSLLLATTSCNNDELEFNDPQPQKQYTKAELIELADSYAPQTRSALTPSATMYTINNEVSIRYFANEDTKIDWGDGAVEDVQKGDFKLKTHPYNDGMPSHKICLLGSSSAIKILHLSDNGLIQLTLGYQTNLTSFYCMNNYLDELDVQYCPNLTSLFLDNNALFSINITSLSALSSLRINNNELKEIDLSNNKNLRTIEIKSNRLTKIDVSQNTNLIGIDVSYNQIKHLDFSNNKGLFAIYIEGLPIETINNTSISDTSFAVFAQLYQLNIAYTPFTSLDLSNNPLVNGINISGTAITQLDISNLQLDYLYVTRSKLEKLIYTRDNITGLYELRMENTPFENDIDNIGFLGVSLPDRSEEIPGRIYTYSIHINDLFLSISGMNWVINPS